MKMVVKITKEGVLDKMLETLKQPDVDRSWQRFTKTNKVNVNETERLASLMGGSGLTLLGLVRRSPQSLLVGGYLLYRALTGHCPAYELAGISTASRTERLQFQPRHSGAALTTAQNGVDRTVESNNPVDETAVETFPASDPPAWTTASHS